VISFSNSSLGCVVAWEDPCGHITFYSEERPLRARNDVPI